MVLSTLQEEGKVNEWQSHTELLGIWLACNAAIKSFVECFGEKNLLGYLTLDTLH